MKRNKRRLIAFIVSNYTLIIKTTAYIALLSANYYTIDSLTISITLTALFLVFTRK